MKTSQFLFFVLIGIVAGCIGDSDGGNAVPSPQQEICCPTTMTVGDRAYNILPILRGGDDGYVRGSVMVSRAEKDKANLGQEECEHLLTNQSDIPVVLRGKVVFVFTDWRHPGGSEEVAYVYWHGDRWVRDWVWLDDDWCGDCRVLRRK